MTVTATDIADRVKHIEDRMAAALARAGRPSGSARLIGASKTVGVDGVRAAFDAGVRLFGENRVQEAAPKTAAVPEAHWHFIGRLQRNKARRAVELFELIHSVDSLRLAETLDRLGQERGRPVDLLLEVNTGGETTKVGFAPAEVEAAVAGLAGLAGLRVLGLMTVPPPVDDPEENRRHFAGLALLARTLVLPELSMGMSDDFEIALEEGATYVRVGTALFGPRAADSFSD
jgi:pyridoxal phosphate enzyme (YggS family)